MVLLMFIDNLRKSVCFSNLDNVIQMNDSETGFSIELTEKYSTAKLQDLFERVGFVDKQLTIAQIRKKQRAIFKENTPPILNRLKERLLQITEEVPFFIKRKNDYDPKKIASITDLKKLPFMRKVDIRNYQFNELIPKNIDLSLGLKEGSITIVSTSGSTDDRLQIVSQTQIDRLPFGSDDLLNIAIGGKQPKTAFFTTPLCSGNFCHLENTAYEKRLSKNSPDLYLKSTVDPFGIQPELINLFCEDIEKFKPTILAANPIYLQCLIRRASELGIKLPKVPCLQYGFEFGHQAAIRDIKNAFFPISTLNDYAASEENRLALECYRGSLHVRSDAVHFEILNTDGECPPGVVGAVAITTFDSITPLVRYLIGDAAEWTGTKCDCEFSDWPTIILHGRLKDMIYINDKWVSTFHIDSTLGAPTWLDFYRFIEYDKNSYEIKIIPALGCTADLSEIEAKLSKYVDPKKIQYTITNRFDPLPSMKIGLVQTRLSGAPEIP